MDPGMEPDNSTDGNASSCITDLNNYPCSDVGLLLPLVNEYTWPVGVRALIYFVGLLWCFLGVAIVADVFMCAIEKITSHTRTIKVASEDTETGYEEVEVKVWNDTVANLTLMALGSSAPEILLACIETVGNDFQSGELGPGTIVGSAAFNLFCITGFCLIVIPKGEVRRIAAFRVFVLTAVFSLFAYVWLAVILLMISPEEVEVWEAVLTFAFFPLLVIVAYVVDRNCFRPKKTKKKKDKDNDEDKDEEEDKELGYSNKLTNFLPWNKKSKKKKKTEPGKMDEDRMRALIKELREIHPSLSEEDLVELATARMGEEQPHDRLWYRINAVKQMSGNPKLTPHFDNRLAKVYGVLKKKEVSGKLEDAETASMWELSDSNKRAVVEFTSAQSAILERDQKVQVTVRRYGKLNCQVVCRIETIDGTAEAEKDYIPMKAPLVFKEGETEKSFDIVIIDDNEWEPDEVFFVKLSLDPEAEDSAQVAAVGKRAIHEVTILNDDDPGSFEFEKPSILFRESEGKAQIPIIRSNGADGKVTLTWKTEDLTAISGRDYHGGQGSITFEHGETTKMLEIPIIDDQEKEKDESFKVELCDIDCPGAKLGRIKKTIVSIVDDDEFNNMVNRMLIKVNVNMDAMRVDSSTWSDQFRNAMNVNGGDIEGATNMDYVMHFLTFGWKLLFAFVPPPSILGGWLSFFTSLIAIGVLTAVVGDLASIFGCLVGLRDTITSITFVAMGTSLPDLFASKQAATMEKTADNSIGNVTGSNSVNVFLGLGLPWLMAAVYQNAKGNRFVVRSGDLGFTVVVFIVSAILCLGVLVLRRYSGLFGRAELGGPTGPKIASGLFLFLLWVVYIALSVAQVYGYINVPF